MDYSSAIRIFDTQTEQITTVASLASSASYTVCGVVGTKIYIFGGQNSNGTLTTIQMFNTETNTISTLTATLPVSNVGYTCGVVGTKIYLFYGTSIYIFDTETNQISTSSTGLANVAISSGCGVIGTKCYVFGGVNGGQSHNNIQVFDTETNQRTTLTTKLPTKAYEMACGVVGTKIYLFYGSNTSSVFLNTINKFTVNISVPQNNLLLIYDIYSKFKIINSNKLEFKINPIDCYKGNSSNIGQQVKIALYNETGQNWEEIN